MTGRGTWGAGGAARPQRPRRPRPQRPRGPLLAPLLVVAIAFCMQSGSALATKVIGAVGIVDALWLRTAIAALILIAVRPRSLRLPPRQQRATVALLALSLLGMNLSFYGAISVAPLGIVVAIEFAGPLVVAVVGSRRPVDFVWIALAAAGIAALVGPRGSIGLGGLVLSLSAGMFWGLYLVFARRAVSSLEPLHVTTLMFCGSAVLLTPVALLFAPRLAQQPSAVGAGRPGRRALLGGALLRRAGGPAAGARRHLQRAAQPGTGDRGTDGIPDHRPDTERARRRGDRGGDGRGGWGELERGDPPRSSSPAARRRRPGLTRSDRGAAVVPGAPGSQIPVSTAILPRLIALSTVS